MDRGIREADWKEFRDLRSLALDRFCERVLAEVQSLATDPDKGAHARYLAVFRLIERRDKELADAFDVPRRSTALRQIAVIRSQGLLTDEEFARFSRDTRDIVESFLR